MDRSGSIDLIDEVENSLEEMRKSGNVSAVKVKAMLEHLRSSLEYLAHDTFVKHQPDKPIPKKLYFPFGNKKFVDSFFNKIGVASPSSSILYPLFTSVQDYHSGESWLTMMCNLTNEVKHRKPISLDTEEKITSHTISAGGWGLVHATNVGSLKVKVGSITIDGESSSGFEYDNGKLTAPNATIPINIALTKDKKIKFHGNEYEVEPFIQHCAVNIRALINNSYDALSKLD